MGNIYIYIWIIIDIVYIYISQYDAKLLNIF